MTRRKPTKATDMKDEIAEKAAEGCVAMLQKFGFVQPVHDGTVNYLLLPIIAEACRKASLRHVEVMFFGCLGQPGHYLQSKRSNRFRTDHLPWGDSIDGGLLPKDGNKRQDGKFVFVKERGFSCVSFWDQSGDSRPASNSAFIVQAEEITADELFGLARQQWPEVFRRPNFPFALTPKETKD